MHTKFELEAIERINKVKANQLYFLDLSGLQLTKIPIDILDLPYLLDIDLSFNQFSSLPKEINSLHRLQHINLSYNSITHIGIDFDITNTFKEINLSNNYLYSFPYELINLNDNVKIVLDNNPFLDNLPIELSSKNDFNYMYFYFESLKNHVDVQRLFETKLLIVGKGDVGKTTLMKTLKDYYFEVNIGEELTTHGININQYDSHVLFPAVRNLYDFKKDFDNLWIGTEDSTLSDDFDNDGNIISKVNLYPEKLDHISNYSDSEYFLRTLFISNNPYHEYDKIYFEKDVKINIWDFGGQEILYSTHQFFLTKRSIYIFVWEPRADSEEESFEYWLNTISRLSNNSPIIVVMNKADIRVKNIDESSYKNRFNNIKGFFKVSCLTKEGIDELNKVINNTICNLPHIGNRLPQTWDDIRLKLKELNKNYISYSEFRSTSNIIETENTQYLIDYLNDIGDIIYFKNNIILKDFIILNPQWLVEAIYELIHSIKIQKNHGFFNSSDLSSYLNKSKYPEEKHFEILSLMEEFEICFKTIGTKNTYIIPALLQANIGNEKLKSEFKNVESLKYKVQYKLIPSGLIERLICRLNNYLAENSFWKYGAIFKNETGKALVELNKLEKNISINVIGEIKSELYTIIVHELMSIHTDLKLDKTEFSQLYACNCIECINDANPYMYKRDYLLKFLKKEKQKIICYKSAESTNIRELLIGYDKTKIENNFLKNYVKAMSILQTRYNLIKSFEENQINTYLQDLLRPFLINKNFFLNEQSLKGKSSSGKKQGELDITIENIEGITKSIFEGIVLNNYDSTKINEHIYKTIYNYDSNGLKEKLIGLYCRAKNFTHLYEKYFNHISKIEQTSDISFIESTDVSYFYSGGSEMKVFKTIYLRNKEKLILYHILTNINL